MYESIGILEPQSLNISSSKNFNRTDVTSLRQTHTLTTTTNLSLANWVLDLQSTAFRKRVTFLGVPTISCNNARLRLASGGSGGGGAAACRDIGISTNRKPETLEYYYPNYKIK
ncbi:hypothetical protein M0802_002400 [Mischocyttarus mexicanus]|nr:hypothetical protein M0802_002400 [Mischocyttarus mexicanus]